MSPSSRALLVPAVLLVACTGRIGSPAGEGDAGVSPDAAAPDATLVDAAATDAAVDTTDAAVDAAEPPPYPYMDLDVGCAPIFRQSIVAEYHVTIAPDHWSAMQMEFLHPALSSHGAPLDGPYHPVGFEIVEGDAHYTQPDVMLRLNGNTSWLQTIEHDANPKMQFMVAFNRVHEDGRFEGLRKIKLDMPRGDRTFLQQRVGLAWLRGRAGVPAQCANNARVYINGDYYGLFSNVEVQDKGFLKRIYGGADNDGDLWKSGREIKTNEGTYSSTRINAFWDIDSLAELSALTELDTSMREWASETVIGDPDGYNQGSPNYFLYDHPSTDKFVWLATDLDTVLDEDFLAPDASPVFAPDRGYWESDGPHYLIALNDAHGVPRYVDAMSIQLPKLDPAEVVMWIDDWSAQIQSAAANDPHRPFSLTQHTHAIHEMKEYPARRAAYLDDWVDCWDDGGADADGDGFDMCHDCDDADAAQSPAAVELCDDIDNDCDGIVDNASSTACFVDPDAAARERLWRRVHIDVKAEADRLQQ